MMEIYAPSAIGEDGIRHIISQRNGPALCGALVDHTTQEAPRSYPGGRGLCVRCQQQYAKRLSPPLSQAGWRAPT